MLKMRILIIIVFLNIIMLVFSLNSQFHRNIVRVSPSGLGLPDRTYYTRFPNDSAVQVCEQHIKSLMIILVLTIQPSTHECQAIQYIHLGGTSE